MPTGNNQRLHAVLQAGQAHIRATGIESDPGSPPLLGMLGAAAKAATDGFTILKGPAPGKPTKKGTDDGNGNQVLPKSSAVAKDTIEAYKKDAKARAEALDKARAEAKLCVAARVQAVNTYQQSSEKAALAAILELEKQLAETEAARDKVQNASDASLAKLDEMKTAGGQSTAQVAELKKTIALLQVEKKSLEDELAALKESCDKARDTAASLAETKRKELDAEWTIKLRECESKNLSKGLDAAKKNEDNLELLVLANKALAAEQAELGLLKEESAKEMNKLLKELKEKAEQEQRFRKAALEACEALKAFTQKK